MDFSFSDSLNFNSVENLPRFNAEVCYGSGLRYDTCIVTAIVKNEVDDFLLDNDLPAYFLGVSQDFKHFGFAVSVLILNEDGTKIVRLLRKEACYCRFAPADASGKIPSVLYANWQRLALFLDLAEDWVVQTFVSTSTYNTICGYTDRNPTKVLTARLVVADALRLAIPSLDIVLTPNGFGVINTSNIAPASKPPIDRLVGSMLSHRDDCIAALLPALVGASKWLTSEQASFFGATFFPDLAIIDSVGGDNGSRWDKYLELRSQVIDLEASNGTTPTPRSCLRPRCSVTIKSLRLLLLTLCI